MMSIVIVGAGELGRHIASVLSREHKVILIDKDVKQLEKASWNTDIATRQGSGIDWQLLDNLLEHSPNFFIAFTGNDETNLISCAIAKHLGYPTTIARISDNHFLNRTRIDFAQIFAVDYFLGPELLVANEILKHLMSPNALAVESFAHGAVQLRTLLIPDSWEKSEVSLADLNLPEGIIVGLINRTVFDIDNNPIRKVIFPHGNEFLIQGDEATFIGKSESIEDLYSFLSLEMNPIKSVFIAGGSKTAFNLAKLLENHDVDVRLIDKDYEQCAKLAEKLPFTTIIHHDVTDPDFLRATKITECEEFVACTNSDEINLVAGLLGKEVGCKNVIAMFSKPSFSSLATQLGISHTVSPRICTTDHILSKVLTGTVTSLVSFYDNQAEIVEVNVSIDSKVVGIPISDLGLLLPEDFLIAIIQNRGRIMVATGNNIISPGDTVIVITSPRHIPELETIF